MPGRKKKNSKKDNKFVWSEKLEYQLIDNYEANPFLYDHTSSDFKNKELKAATVDGFDKKLGVPDGASKAHIETIRTRYGRDKKEFLQPPSGSARKEPPEVERVFMRRMAFLYKHITPRPTRNSLYKRKLVTDEDGQGDCPDEGKSPTDVDVVVGVWTENCDENNASHQEEVVGGSEGIDENVLKDVEIVIGEENKWNGDGSEPVDNIGELEVPSEEERETLEAAMILNDIDKKVESSGAETVGAGIVPTDAAISEDSSRENPTNNVTGVETGERTETAMEVDIQETNLGEMEDTIQSKTSDAPLPLPTPNNIGTETQDSDSINAFVRIDPKPSTSTPFNANDYIPKDCMPPPRSPTPPPPRKKPFVPPVKKGFGKSTIKSPVKGTSGSKKSQNENSDTISGQLETERLNVLRNLGNSLLLDAKEEGDRDYHWTKSLLGQAKSVENKILKEQSIAVCNVIMTYAVIGLKHPAVEAMFPTVPSRNIGYSVTLPNPSQMQQYPSVYYAPPPFANPNPTNIRPQQQVPTRSNPPQPNVSGNPPAVNPSAIPNVQGVGTPSFSTAAAAASAQGSYLPPTNEYPYSLNNSPMKGQPNIYCHTLNTFGAGQQQTGNALDFSQM